MHSCPASNSPMEPYALRGSALGVGSGELRRALFLCNKASMICRALFCLALCCAALPAAAKPQRVVSINLCADQLLVALAAPGQIAALSPLARDKRLSYVAGAARSLPVHRGTAEDIVKTQADLVLIRASDLNMQPVHDAVNSVVFQTTLANIDSVMIAGQWKKRHGQLQGVVLPPLLEELQASGRRIVQAMGLA